MAAKKIQYSISLRPNPLQSDEPEKAYANLQLTGKYTTKDLCEHIAGHNGIFNRAVVEGVLIQLGTCIRELVLQGYSIVLGELGTITPSIKSQGAPTLTDFSSDDIIDMDVNFTPGEVFKDLRDDAEFEQTSSRAAQAAALLAQKQGLTTADWTAKDENGGGQQDDQEP
ncbi:MAG: DNA-binding protein [Bacteroidaceae bacterium]|nr:DNA-binding protein [Bacteroidaceae bacterium]